MEILVDFVITVSISLFISFALSKLLSVVSEHEIALKSAENLTKIEHFDESGEENGRMVNPAATGIQSVAGNGKLNDSGEIEDSDDDWEAIDRTELEKLFGLAVGLADEQISRLDIGLRLRLYGLHKVAIEGPCHEPPPVAFKVFARAKWNAWHQIRDMNVEEAMEQYISVLSDRFPGWLEENHKPEKP